VFKSTQADSVSNPNSIAKLSSLQVNMLVNQLKQQQQMIQTNNLLSKIGYHAGHQLISSVGAPQQ
jgi:hypothetical protein